MAELIIFLIFIVVMGLGAIVEFTLEYLENVNNQRAASHERFAKKHHDYEVTR